ncbi:acyl carrier protein [Paenibacillus hexagrammi]|uniref:Acyl carrier protein n=1 Tax=Paenibacillus hexagrammi TaxID=2908839 RepID=A0ABY3SL34_9BACL|nr:acyl carrier protein [Paenibacillus sp. YPD9-1]UJF34769.1 acyl carrier protein [Paenibacillus sp. YPD9-1]
MTKDEVFTVVKGCIMEILPDLSEGDIRIELSLKDLGANSIDRADIAVSAMEAIGLKMSMVEFGQVKNIQELVNLLYGKKAALV